MNNQSSAANNDIVHVTQDSQLAGALALLAQGNYLALDTEFLRERTYFAKLCLLQLGNEYACVVIDVLALSTLTPLLEFINDRTRLKVLHAGRQDMEVLYQAGEKQAADIKAQVPGPIFDTQVAAGLLGLPAQIGYGDLLNRKLGIDLAKGLARTDWSQRPLSDAQLHYAADDVRYLGPLYQALLSELQQRERSHWLEEETVLLENPSLYSTLPEAAWQRLRGTQQLNQLQRAALKQLAAWRETRAIEKDKPRGWILSDEALRDLSENLPHTLDELSRTRDLPAGVVSKHGETLLNLIVTSEANAANEAPANDWRPTSQQQKQVSKLMQTVRNIAEDISVSAELLATRRDMEQLVYFNNGEALLEGWRRNVIGERLIAARELLHGVD